MPIGEIGSRSFWVFCPSLQFLESEPWIKLPVLAYTLAGLCAYRVGVRLDAELAANAGDVDLQGELVEDVCALGQLVALQHRQPELPFTAHGTLAGGLHQRFNSAGLDQLAQILQQLTVRPYRNFLEIPVKASPNDVTRASGTQR